MNVHLITYLDSSNGITLQLEGETEIETNLLMGLGKHGNLTVRDRKLCIDWRLVEVKDEK